MAFPFNLFLLAVAGAFLTTLAAMPLWLRWCQRTGLVDDPGHRKIHDHPIALAGGLGVMTGLTLPVLAAAAFLWWQGWSAKTTAESGWVQSLAHIARAISPPPLRSTFPLQYGLSQRALAQAAGVAQSALSGYEAGRVLPTCEVFERILAACA